MKQIYKIYKTYIYIKYKKYIKRIYKISNRNNKSIISTTLVVLMLKSRDLIHREMKLISIKIPFNARFLTSTLIG